MERLKRLEVDRLLSSPIIFSPATPISKIVGALKQVNGYEVFLEGTDKIGMVTLRDILRTSNVTKAKAETLAFYVPKLQPRSSVYEAVRLMMEYHIRALPIVSMLSFTIYMQRSRRRSTVKSVQTAARSFSRW